MCEKYSKLCENAPKFVWKVFEIIYKIPQNSPLHLAYSLLQNSLLSEKTNSISKTVLEKIEVTAFEVPNRAIMQIYSAVQRQLCGHASIKTWKDGT